MPANIPCIHSLCALLQAHADTLSADCSTRLRSSHHSCIGDIAGTHKQRVRDLPINAHCLRISILFHQRCIFSSQDSIIAAQLDGCMTHAALFKAVAALQLPSTTSNQSTCVCAGSWRCAWRRWCCTFARQSPPLHRQCCHSQRCF